MLEEARRRLPRLEPREAGPQKEKDRKQPGTRLEFEFTNDSFEDRLGIVPREHRRQTDDKGFTSEVRLDGVRTEGDRQAVTSGTFLMITEQGSWDPGPDYGGRRQDVLELAHQRNFRMPLDGEGRTRLVYGIGGGLQIVGNLGGRTCQENFHRYAPFGGRLGPEEGLQIHYPGDRSVSPLLTGGVGLRHRLDGAGRFRLTADLQGTVPLGSGLGALKAEAGLQARPVEGLRVDAGVNLSRPFVRGHDFDFLELGALRPGEGTAWRPWRSRSRSGWPEEGKGKDFTFVASGRSDQGNLSPVSEAA